MTPQELREAVLKEMGVVAAGESANPEDAAVVADKYTLLHGMLEQKNLVTWTLTDDIPSSCAQPVVWMLAYLCAGAFGAQQEPEKGALDLPSMSLAERQLRAQLAPFYVYSPAQSEYF